MNHIRLAAIQLLTIVLLVHASVLSNAAASLQAGQWAEVTANVNLPTDFFNGYVTSDAILSYSYKAVWFPDSQWILFCGCGHGGDGKFIIYKALENVWEIRPARNGSALWHSYGYNTLDAKRGYFYFYNPRIDAGGCGWKPVERYNIRTGIWDSASIIGATCTPTGMLEYFPERDTLIYYGSGTAAFRIVNGSLSGVMIGPTGNRYNQECLGVYSKKHKSLMAGFGIHSYSTNEYRFTADILDSGYNLTTTPPCSSVFAMTSTSVLVSDPLSGDFLLFGNPAKFVVYDPLTRIWKSMPAPTVPIFEANKNATHTVAVPIDSMGIIVFLKRDAAHISKLFIYKHDSTAGTILTTGKEAGSGIRNQTAFTCSPNPIQGRSTFSFFYPAGENAVSLCIFDSRGQLVCDLTSGILKTGTSRWNTAPYPSGYYVARLSNGRQIFTGKLVLMR